MKRQVVAAAVLLAWMLAGCSSSGGDDLPPQYVQTWKPAYSATTCGEWLDKMTQAQNFAGATDLLIHLRNGDDPNSAMPSDDLIHKFEMAESDSCEESRASTITDIATSLYLAEHSTYKP